MSINKVWLFCLLSLLLCRIADAGVAASFWQLEETTPLLEAAKKGDMQKLQQLLKQGNINEQNDGGSTPLIFALAYKQPQVVKFLVKNGANVNLCGSDNMCPLWYAVTSDSYDMTKLMIDSGADASVQPGINALEHSTTGRAAATGRLDILKLLVENGADIHHAQMPWGNTALAFAVRIGKTRTAEYLISIGANLREVTEKIYYNGETALQIAEREGHVETVNLVKRYMKQSGYKPIYTMDAVIERIFKDPNFDMAYDSTELDDMLHRQTQENLRIIRNAIFAKKNYKFDDTDLIIYFRKKFPKYKPEKKKIKLSPVDKSNVRYMQQMEEYARGRDAAG